LATSIFSTNAALLATDTLAVEDLAVAEEVDLARVVAALPDFPFILPPFIVPMSLLEDGPPIPGSGAVGRLADRRRTALSELSDKASDAAADLVFVAAIRCRAEPVAADAAALVPCGAAALSIDLGKISTPWLAFGGLVADSPPDISSNRTLVWASLAASRGGRAVAGFRAVRVFAVWSTGVDI
jgi:hypothetical protein